MIGEKGMNETWKYRIAIMSQWVLILAICIFIFLLGEFNALNFTNQVATFCGKMANTSIGAFGDGWITYNAHNVNVSILGG